MQIIVNISKNGRNNEIFLPWKPLISTKRVKISNYILFLAGFDEIPLIFMVHNEYFEKIHNRASSGESPGSFTTNPRTRASRLEAQRILTKELHNGASHQGLKIGSTTNPRTRVSRLEAQQTLAPEACNEPSHRRLATNPHPEPSPRSLPPQPYTLVNTFSPC